MTDTTENTAVPSAELDIKHMLELALLTAAQPLDMKSLRRVGGGADAAAVRQALDNLRQDWETRALRLIESASGYQFVSRPEYNEVLARLNRPRPPRMSRSLLEVLAIIAYRQPVTRGNIEEIRGVAVSSSQLAFLEEQGWIEEIGRRETPGRPILYATTKTFLDDLGLASLEEMPSLEALEEEADDLIKDAEDNGEAAAAEASDAAESSESAEESDSTESSESTEPPESDAEPRQSD